MQPSFGTISIYPQPGDVLDGKYRVEHLLGEGGMGAVARATHLLRRAPVALKFMSGAVLSLPGAVERFVNEGVAASQIDSDHVVKIFDVGRLPSGAPYLVMELLDGRDLGQLIEREGPTLDVARAVHFTVQTLRALQTAHAAGIVHRDMKPSNIFIIEKDGEPDFVKLVDFGISKVRTADDGQPQAPHLTRTNSALGTPLYMSPEQARSPRDVDQRTDLYSVGAILYEMLTGRTPYTSDTGEYTEILFKIFTTEPEPIVNLRADLPTGLAEVIHRALQRERDERFSSAADMAEALAPFADERSHTVLTRLRTGRRSTMPRASRAVTPAAEHSRATQAEATARTHASDGPAPHAPSTAVGVTRESPAAAPERKRPMGALIAVAVVIVAAIAGTSFALLGSHGAVAPKHASETEAPAPPAAVPLPPAVTGSLTASPAASPAVVLAPENTATPAPSASTHASPPPKQTPPHLAGNGNPIEPAPTAPSPNLPTQLGDLKLH